MQHNIGRTELRRFPRQHSQKRKVVKNVVILRVPHRSVGRPIDRLLEPHRRWGRVVNLKTRGYGAIIVQQQVPFLIILLPFVFLSLYQGWFCFF